MKRFFAALLLVSAPCLAQSIQGAAPPSMPLRNLSAGSTLTFKQPLLIRANNSTQVLSSGGPMGCTLRMRRAEHFDRIIPAETRITVSDAHEESVVSHKLILRHTTIEVDSGAVDSITCAPSAHSAAEPRLGDFVSATGSLLALNPGAAAEVR